MNKTFTPIELIGGPFCGNKIDRTQNGEVPQDWVAVPCKAISKTTGNHQYDHLHAVYKKESSTKALFMGYQELE